MLTGFSQEMVNFGTSECVASCHSPVLLLSAGMGQLRGRGGPNRLGLRRGMRQRGGLGVRGGPLTGTGRGGQGLRGKS